ncbi:Haloacid dehalogenase-like hydrolase [Pseudohyphozyma bogoriensis]|nr:Haloacid dehalogenase-like hydrolase [Pseudohyphozyma bogoriensis]
MMAQASTADPVVLTAINNLRLKTTLKIGALTNNFIVPSSSPTSSSSNAKPKDPAPRPRHHPLTIVELEGHMRSEHEKDESTRGSPAEVLKSVFDVFVESSVVGMRKPDPAFYEYALKQLGVMAEETVFLDDIGINLVAAKKLGIKTIRVHPGKSVDAVKELEGYVGVKLRDGAGDAKL